MCGFVALVGPGSAAPGVIEAGLRAIRHRGPDGEGVHRAGDGRVAMGHARLAILDLSNAGSQPMHTADGRGVLVYNGEIYNFRELAARLDHPLRSSSDTEVLIELLRARGARAVPLLRGMFAFAYWDGEELLLVRDRLGIKPLFYVQTKAGGIGAASELGALVAMGITSRTPDVHAIDDFLTYLYVPPPRTGILGVKELPPGHLLRWRPGGEPVVERYWQPPSEAPKSPPSPEEVRALLDDAVRAHLVSDEPVGVFLSGGLDSSSIVALAARHYPGALRTFSITFGDEGKYLDERHFARETAERYGTRHEEIRVNADVAEILPELVRHFGQPFGNPTAVLTYALSRATRKHVKVALAGDGGDEVFGGYPRYKAVWFSELYRRVPRAVRALVRSALETKAAASSARGLPKNRLKRFFDGAQLPPDTAYFRWITYLDGMRKGELLRDRPAMLRGGAPDGDFEFLDELRARYNGRSTRDVAPLVDLLSFLPHNVLNYGDRMSMAHALEVRPPFCDHVLVERVAPMALEAKMPGGVQKGLLRWAMRRDLPVPVLLHRKVGFNPPIASWLRTELAPLVDTYLGDGSVRARGLFDPNAVAKLRRDVREGRAGEAHTLWSLLVLEAWMRWLGEAPAHGES